MLRPARFGATRARVLAWAGLLIVVGIVLLAGPLAGQLAHVEENGPTSQLPRGYGSTLVEDELSTFDRSAIQPAVAVYERDGGLTAEDRATIESDADTFAAFAAGEVRVEYAVDDAAALVVVPLDLGPDDGLDHVEDMRDLTEDRSTGLDVEVTGPAGTFYDQVAVFDGLDARILLASAAVVIVVLLLTYRSPVLWLLPMVSIAVAMVLSQALVYLLAKHADLPVNGQSGGIVPILVFGVGTDYALLLISRYREELHLHADRYVAIGAALRRSVAPIAASAATVVLGLCCLLLADLNNIRSLGAVCAIGVGCAALSMLVTLPALLAVTGRWIFWPFVPRADHDGGRVDELATSPGWRRVAAAVSARPRAWAAASSLVLLVAALGSLAVAHTATNAEQFRDPPGSVLGQQMLDRHFTAGSSAPATVLVDADSAADAAAALREVSGVATVGDPELDPSGTRALLPVVLADEPDSDAARATVDTMRDRLAEDPDALVGGPTAQLVDVADATVADLRLVVPAVLLVVLLVLVLLLRALLGPVLLLATVLLSYAAALGLGALALLVMGFDAMDVTLPLLEFVFLVSLGVDYTIFLMSRIREEVQAHGHDEGVRRGLVATGGVITSAGLVLAATFGILVLTPVASLIGLGAIVSLGILLDTFVVRSVLVPALWLDLGRRVWWPGLR